MSREGKYAAWFRTPRGEGTGVVHIADGKICGGDSTFDRMVFCSGVAEQAPDIRFEATLFPSHDEVRPAEVKREVATFDPAKLPKSDGDRRRARNPFGTDRPTDRMCTVGPPRRS